MRDEEIEKIIKGDTDYSDLFMLIIPLPMVIFTIVMVVTKFV